MQLVNLSVTHLQSVMEDTMGMRISVSGILPGGEQWANILHDSQPLNETNANEVNTAALSAYDALKTVLSTGWELTEIVVTDPETAEQGFVFVPAVQFRGSSTGDNLPNEVALVVSWRTALRGRSFRGRTYLAGFTEVGNQDTGSNQARPTTAVMNAAIDFGGIWSSGVSRAPSVYSRLLNDYNLITGGYINDEWDTQRRRGASLPGNRNPFVPDPAPPP